MQHIPTAASADELTQVPVAAPLDAHGNSLVPELAGRAPTHNESELLSGETIAMGSTNVSEIWYHWQARRLFVRFLSGALYCYDGVSLAVAVGMVETDSPGRYVWNVLKAEGYAYRLLSPAPAGGGRKKPQVVRLVRK